MNWLILVLTTGLAIFGYFLQRSQKKLKQERNNASALRMAIGYDLRDKVNHCELNASFMAHQPNEEGRLKISWMHPQAKEWRELGFIHITQDDHPMWYFVRMTQTKVEPPAEKYNRIQNFWERFFAFISEVAETEMMIAKTRAATET